MRLFSTVVGTDSASAASKQSPLRGITRVLYEHTCGLLIATIEGDFALHDALEFKHVWTLSNKKRKVAEKTSITAMSYSKRSGMVALGGDQGTIVTLDPSAQLVNGAVKAHHSDIVELFFHDAQLQLLSVSVDQSVCLWDANKMECLQTV